MMLLFSILAFVFLPFVCFCAALGGGTWEEIYDSSNLQGPAADDGGGWKWAGEIPISAVDDDEKSSSRCTIKRVKASSLTQTDFLERYAYSQPVIIEGYRENDSFRKLCRRERLLAEWGQQPVVLASANTYSYMKVESTLDEYIRNQMRPQKLETLGNETLYLFGDIDHSVWKPLLDQFQLPLWTLPGHEPALSFGLASIGTGVPFHFHGPGFAEVIHGSKRWFLLEFERKPDFDPDHSTLHWYFNVFPKLTIEDRPLECLLKPGELIYFPDRWWHATLNVETSVFVSTFLSPVSGSSIIRGFEDKLGDDTKWNNLTIIPADEIDEF